MSNNKYYGREKQLELLNERFNSSSFEFGYIYGQRRIGKSTLLNMLSENKKTLMFYATDSSDIEQREAFSRTLNKTFNVNNGVYKDWNQFFEAMDNFIKDEKVLVCFDEYPLIVLNRD